MYYTSFNTRSKKEDTTWKAMKNLARKCYIFLCTINFEVTWPFWKMWSKKTKSSLFIFLLQNEFCPTFRFLIHFGIPKTGWGTIWNFQKSSKNSKSSKTEIHNKDNLSTSILRGSCCPGHVPKFTAPWMSRPWLEFPYLVASVTNRGRWWDRTAGGLARLSPLWVAAHVPCTTQDQEL